VRQLLLLHLAELGGVGGLEAERVEAEVARVVVGLELLDVLLPVARVRVLPPLLDAQRLADADAERHEEPDGRRQRGDLLDGRATVRREERVEALLHQEARRGEHAHAAVRELRLAPPVDLALGGALEEVGGVKVAGRGDVALRAGRERGGDVRGGEGIGGAGLAPAASERGLGVASAERGGGAPAGRRRSRPWRRRARPRPP